MQDDFKKYLPQHLTEEDQNRLFSSLNDFPNSFPKKAYSTKANFNPIIYQGDGFRQMPHSNLPTNNIKEVKTIILSNTCDLSPDNSRFSPSRLVQAPIIELKKYHQLLISLNNKTKSKSPSTITTHIENIRKQRINNIFFLPENSFIEDSIVPFDNVSSLPSNYLSGDEVPNRRLFSLSDYGFYVFLYKLSIHFTRMKEGVSRG